MTTFQPGWLQRQVAKCVAALDELPPKLRASLSNGRPAPRPALDCGCPDDGRVVYGCIHCNHTRCAEHRDQPHPCPAKAVAP